MEWEFTFTQFHLKNSAQIQVLTQRSTQTDLTDRHRRILGWFRHTGIAAERYRATFSHGWSSHRVKRSVSASLAGEVFMTSEGLAECTWIRRVQVSAVDPDCEPPLHRRRSAPLPTEPTVTVVKADSAIYLGSSIVCIEDAKSAFDLFIRELTGGHCRHTMEEVCVRAKCRWAPHDSLAKRHGNNVTMKFLKLGHLSDVDKDKAWANRHHFRERCAVGRAEKRCCPFILRKCCGYDLRNDSILVPKKLCSFETVGGLGAHNNSWWRMPCFINTVAHLTSIAYLQSLQSIGHRYVTETCQLHYLLPRIDRRDIICFGNELCCELVTCYRSVWLF